MDKQKEGVVLLLVRGIQTKKGPSRVVKGLEEGGDLLSHLVWQYHRR